MDIVDRLKEAAEASMRTTEEWRIDPLMDAAEEITTLRAKLAAAEKDTARLINLLEEPDGILGSGFLPLNWRDDIRALLTELDSNQAADELTAQAQGDGEE